MPRISAERLQDRVEGLLDAARSVFAEKGYLAATMTDIAREAGVSDGLAYRYFTSKRELLLAILDGFYARIIHDLEQSVVTIADFEVRFFAFIHKHIELFVSDVDVCRLVIAEVRNFEDYFGSEAHDLNRRYTSVLMRILDAGVAEGRIAPHIDGRLVRDMLFGGIEHLAWRHIVLGQPIDVDRVARQIGDMLLGGLRGSQTL